MASFGVVITARNDDYGGHLTERAAYCLNSMLESLDEVIFVDWNTPDNKVTLIEEMGDALVKSSKFHWIRVSSKQASEWTNNDAEAQGVCEVQARNVGLRRLSTEYLISSNIDVICPKREILDSRISIPTSFVTTAKRSISLYVLRDVGSPNNIQEVMHNLIELEKDYGQQPYVQVRPDDHYSLVSSPGDFQIAHRDIWYKIRGFEERFYKRGFTDTNIQRKAKINGFDILVDRQIPVWHIGHEAGWGGTGGVNDMDLALTMVETTNPPTWGHIDSELVMESFNE